MCRMTQSDLNTSKKQPSITIMGVLNATPDSFSGDGVMQPTILVKRGLKMLSDGAQILDIGGESSRPSAVPVSSKEEMQRIMPVIRSIRKQTDALISVDTRNPDTAKAALDEGVDILNDISGFQSNEMLALANRTKCHIVIMHMQGLPKTMQNEPVYSDVVSEVGHFLSERVQDALNAGIDLSKIIVDPGIGFGKTLCHNLQLVQNLQKIRVYNCPILLGVSRKSMIGNILDLPVDQRLEGSLATAAVGFLNGADIIRVHDVAETSRFFKTFIRVMGHAGK